MLNTFELDQLSAANRGCQCVAAPAGWDDANGPHGRPPRPWSRSRTRVVRVGLGFARRVQLRKFGPRAEAFQALSAFAAWRRAEWVKAWGKFPRCW